MAVGAIEVTERPAHNDPTIAKTNRVMTIVALWLGALLVAWYGRHVLLLVFAGILFAVFLHRLACYLRNCTGLPRGWSLAAVTTAIFLLITGAFWLRGGQIAHQATELATQLPEAFRSFSERMSSSELAQWVDEQMPSVETITDTGNVLGRITSALSGIVGAFVTTFLIVFLTLAFAATPSVYQRGVLKLFPLRRRQRIADLLDALGHTLWWWLIGRLISMTFVGLGTGIGLWLLGVPLAFVLGVLAALLSFVPNLGPILSAVPAVLLAWVEGPRLMSYVIALYIGVQTVENYLLTPVLDRKTVYLPPALTVSAQLLLGISAGLIGVAFAAPLVAALMTVTRRVYVGDVLGDPGEQPAERVCSG